MSYVADPQRWYFLLQIPGLWRAMFLVNEDASDERVQTHEFAQSLMAGVVPGITNYEIAHTTLYKVHQRVAKTFRLGRAFLVGDAAHINNPLGGMGMNGGIHDAINLTRRLAPVWHGQAPEAELDRYDTQRRLVTLETSRSRPSRTRRTWRHPEPFGASLRAIAADPARTRDYLLRVSMIASCGGRRSWVRPRLPNCHVARRGVAFSDKGRNSGSFRGDALTRSLLGGRRDRPTWQALACVHRPFRLPPRCHKPKRSRFPRP